MADVVQMQAARARGRRGRQPGTVTLALSRPDFLRLVELSMRIGFSPTESERTAAMLEQIELLADAIAAGLAPSLRADAIAAVRRPLLEMEQRLHGGHA